jgi:pimeloyl-ACP methyl ester carboxylesterase
MAQQDIILIHGTWGSGESWGPFADELRRLGLRVHTPTLRHHGTPQDDDVWELAERVRRVSLTDYVDDLQREVEQMETAPIILGHSLGGLIAQLLAARVECAGLILLSTAPSRGMFALYPSMLRLWGPHAPTWLLSRPMFPVPLQTFRKRIANVHSDEDTARRHRTQCAESGRAYRQMCLWFLDPTKASQIDPEAIQAPVLVVGGTEDRCVDPRVAKSTARLLGSQAQLRMMRGADHEMASEKHMPETLRLIAEWGAEHGLLPSARKRR